jgi:hypothetical protein
LNPDSRLALNKNKPIVPVLGNKFGCRIIKSLYLRSFTFLGNIIGLKILENEAID